MHRRYLLQSKIFWIDFFNQHHIPLLFGAIKFYGAEGCQQYKATGDSIAKRRKNL
jgi:hypothetical protein